MLMGVVLALAIAAAIGNGASSAGADETCTNEAIRLAQHATQTGDCRAWERVSPADKGGGDIVAEGESITAASGGDAAAFDSRYGFADSAGSGSVGRTTYLARRGGDGWSVHAITPTPSPEISQVFAGNVQTEVFSTDLSRVRVLGYDLPGVSGDTPNRGNMYLEDTATGALRTVSSSQRGNGEDPIQYWPFEFRAPELWGASDDLLHMTWESNTQLLPTGTAENYPQGFEYYSFVPEFFPYPYVFSAGNVYTWDEGVLHLASILPDGSAPPEGARVDPRGFPATGVRGTMSADGSRQMFLAPPFGNSQLYLRIDHSRTARISESENEAFTEEAQGVFFQGMTPDGRNVFFATESPLLAADDAPGPDLYRWTDGPDPENEDNLTLITDNGSVVSDRETAIGGALIGMSDDGSRVYLRTSAGKLEFWEEGSGLGTIDNKPYIPRGIDLLSTVPGFGRVSPDGNWMVYMPQVEGDKGTGGTGELRFYDRRRGTLTTIASHASLIPAITEGGEVYNVGFRPRFLSNDGRVFFTSREALAPEDTNGVADVYEYDGAAGKLSLVTSGKGSEPMEFADASADGKNVFFVTRAQLVPSDNDEYADLYVARVDGGFDEPEASLVGPCSGEACQGGSGGSVSSPRIASGAATRGNLHQPRCARNRHRVRRHGKVRCVKRHHRGKARPTRGGAK